jgi:hypothetical protein
VVSFIQSRSDQGQVAALRAWLLSKPIRQLEGKVDAQKKVESIEQYAERVQSTPPSRERVALVARYVEAQRAGEFYVLIGERLRAAVRRIAEHIEAAELIRVEEPSDAERAEQLQQYRMVSVVSFMQHLEPLSDDEVRRLVEAYASPSGQWYVETYTAALLSAIDTAAAAAVAKPWRE